MRKILTVVASVIIMLCIGSVYAWSIIAYELIEKYGFSAFQSQIIFGMIIAVFPVTMIFVGQLGKKIKQKYFGYISGLLFFMGYFLASYSQGNFILILLGIGLLAGIATGFGYWVALTSPVQWFPEKKGLITGIAAAGFGLGAVFMSEVSEIILNHGYNVLQLLKIIGISYGLIIHIADIHQLEKLVLFTDERVYQLAERFWPGPLTMVLPKSNIVPGIVTSGLSTVGIRMPGNEIALELIRKSDCPIAAPSANKFGRISPTTAAHVKKQLPDVDYILEGGKTTVGIESTIIRLTENGFQILRSGSITQEELSTIIPFDSNSLIEKLSAPGMLKSHYSPRKKLLIAVNAKLNIDKTKAGLISFSGDLEYGYHKVIRVSERKDLKDYAANLFEAMHSFEDDNEIEIIIAEPVNETGIGKAIMDRLRKAEFNWRQDSFQMILPGR